MPRPTCETCKAFYALNSECRRHAPVMVPVPQQDPITHQVTGMRAMGVYPATEKAKGCCEHVQDDTPQLQ